MAGNEGVFREHLKDILIHKDDLESHFERALELASTKEELMKLSAGAKKLERYLNGVQEDIGKKLGDMEPKRVTQVKNDKVASVSLTEHVQAAPNDHNGNTQINHPKNDNKAAVENYIQSSSSNSSFTKPAGNSQENLEKENARQSYFDGPSSNVQYQQQNRTYISSSSELASPLTKKDHAPDNLKVFIPNIGPLSEQQVFAYFERFGHVQDVIKTSYPHKPPTAIVRFIHPDSVQTVLESARHNIEQFPVYPKLFTSTQEAAKRRAEMKQSGPQIHFPHRYQVYCGGISSAATIEDVKKALLEHTCGAIRDIKMPLMDKTTKHRGFAFIDYERNDDAEHICRLQFLRFCGRQVECKPNMSPMPTYLRSGVNVMSLADSLPNVPPTSSESPAPRSQNELVTTSPSINDENQDKCIICRVKPKICMLLWCGHTATCMDCGKQLTHCPLNGCNEAVARTMDASQ